MAFRHDGKQAHEWQQWLETYRDVILRCGLPDSILQSRFRWVHFLEHLDAGGTGETKHVVNVRMTGDCRLETVHRAAPKTKIPNTGVYEQSNELDVG